MRPMFLVCSFSAEAHHTDSALRAAPHSPGMDSLGSRRGARASEAMALKSSLGSVS